jgi:NAD(P)H-nitrite reductase large subunit
MQRHVIIGNGIAGVSAAEAIRSLDENASITFIAREEHLPYSRPMISHVLAATANFSQLPLRSADYYRELQAEVLIGQEAVGIDWGARKVQTNRGMEVSFDRLLVASGANPRRLKVEGAGCQGVFTMRDAEDVRQMIDAIQGSKHALVLGGGLVGFKAAYGLVRRGLSATMLIRSNHPLAMQVDSEAGALIQRELERHGLTVRVGIEATAIESGRNGRVARASLSSGESIDCQMVVVGKGVWPSTQFLGHEPIKIDAGILVDDHLKTNIEGVYAAGDVAEHFDIARGQRWLNAIWPVAVEMGRIAGMNMAGRQVRYRGSLSRNVIRIFDQDVLTAGVVNPPTGSGHEIRAVHDLRRRIYRKLVFREEHLVGAVLVGQVEHGGVLMNAIAGRIPLEKNRERLLDPGFSYACLAPFRKAGFY